MRFALAVRTVPQRRELFLDLLEQLAVAFCHPEVVALSISADANVAPNENACLALEGAAIADCDWILFLEDDAGLVKDFVGSVGRWLSDHERPDVHLYALGSPLCVSDVPAVAWPIEQFYCSVALAVRASQAASLVAYLRANAHVRTGFDIMSGHWHRTVSDSPCLLAAQPCLADHLGDVSTLIETRPERNVVGRFKRFLGADYSYHSVVNKQQQADPAGKEAAHG